MKKIGTNITTQVIHPGCKPEKAHLEDAAYDLKASTSVEVRPHMRIIIPLGFKIALPTNMALLVQPRSGQSAKGMIADCVAPRWVTKVIGPLIATVRLNADVVLGLVDSEYGGEVGAIVKTGRFRIKHRLLRLLGFKLVVKAGSRIAQGRFVYVPNIEMKDGVVDNKRNGFGSTDKS